MSVLFDYFNSEIPFRYALRGDIHFQACSGGAYFERVVGLQYAFEKFQALS